ncbi:CRISPR-associated endonuclease Cas2 [Intestinicryptomonas porci]|uniref:CRISPR-associated endoribonuclease Cas2 n=1 Tax=Intestinicryptomonas porci TaxID=2926320 RepID=A0ABU4WJZ5_9BACT|nr:CRISPR-associated endonuclease Cas2 [Opitutales bacterium CLA-KB-P66]
MKIEKKSPFRMGWLMAMFDLPVLLEEERKEATRFRKALLDDGFIMIQYSVYSRPCVSLEKMMKYYERVKTYAPTTGDIRLLFFTDKQWGMSKLVCRAPKKLEKIPKQIEFFDSLQKEEPKYDVDENNNFLLF